MIAIPRMPGRVGFASLGLGLLAAAGGPAVAEPGTPDCQIVVTPGPGFVRLEAIARSKGPVLGRYEFSVTQSSETGASTSHQAGPISGREGDAVVLATIVLAHAVEGQFKAELVLNWSERRVQCSVPLKGQHSGQPV